MSKQKTGNGREILPLQTAAALHDHDQGQTSRRDPELAFQRARDEWLCLQDKMKFDVANLSDNTSGEAFQNYLQERSSIS